MKWTSQQHNREVAVVNISQFRNWPESNFWSKQAVASHPDILRFRHVVGRNAWQALLLCFHRPRGRAPFDQHQRLATSGPIYWVYAEFLFCILSQSGCLVGEDYKRRLTINSTCSVIVRVMVVLKRTQCCLCCSRTTVLFRSTLTRAITLYELLILLGLNHLLSQVKRRKIEALVCQRTTQASTLVSI